MRIWLVCRDGRPRAVFSTAGGAKDFVNENGSETRCDVQYLVLDGCTRAQHQWDFRFVTNRTIGEQR